MSAFLKPGSSNVCVFITEQGSHSGGVHDINLYQVDNTVLGRFDINVTRHHIIIGMVFYSRSRG